MPRSMLGDSVLEFQALDAPKIIQQEFPITPLIEHHVNRARADIVNVMAGRDPRILVVMGPCSIHDEQSALEYGARLLTAQSDFKDELLLVMRVYFEKPRTSIGWKGFINDPDLDGSFQINKGLRLARKLLLKLNDMGVPCGSEFLDVISPQYYADLIAWGAIGARTTESQVHREMASGLSVPLGFKNGTDGNLSIAVDAVRSARSEHHFLSITQEGQAAIFKTSGNDQTHVILRGSHDATNYDHASIEKVCRLLASHQLSQRVMVDCSHGNSQRRYENQLIAARSVIAQLASGDHRIMGLMFESHLLAGQQPFTPASLTYGLSITDPCMGWEMTYQILQELSSVLKQGYARA